MEETCESAHHPKIIKRQKNYKLKDKFHASGAYSRNKFTLEFQYEKVRNASDKIWIQLL